MINKVKLIQKIGYNILFNMKKKCSILSQNTPPSAHLLQSRPYTQVNSRKKKSITESSTSVNRYKIYHRQKA